MYPNTPDKGEAKSMAKVRLLAEDEDSEASNPLTLTEERLSVDPVRDGGASEISRDDRPAATPNRASVRKTVGNEHLYAPDPPDAAKRPSVLLTVAGFILVTEFCERLAFYGFAGSLVLFFQTELGYSNAVSDVQFSAWSGICYITPLLGGYIADTYLGRYKTILIFCCIYLVGLIMVVIGSAPGDVNANFFFPAIYIIALGTGGIKPNVSTMGADQFDERYSQDRLEMQSFFNWFYWMVNLGALLAYSVVAYFCQYGLPSAGGPKWGFFLGYMIPAVAMFVGIVIFLVGTPRYVLKRPAGSVVAVALSIVYDACVTRYHVPRPSTGLILDKASEIHGGTYPDRTVQGVKYVARLVPFLFVLVPFWGIYSQMSTAFQNQACQMDLDLGSGIMMPVSALNSFDTIAILLLVPVFDRLLYPKVANMLGRQVTMLEKIGAGLVFAILAMCVAAIVEVARIAYSPSQGNYYDVAARDNFTPCQSIRDYDPYTFQSYLANTNDDSNQGAPLYCSQTCNDFYIDPASQQRYLNLTCISCDDLPQMSRLSVFWQIPQFFLIGVAEILTSITSLEFFYSQAPTAMRSVSQSLNLATTALGSFLVIPLLLLVNDANPTQPWVPPNLDEGHLTWYFTLLAALMALTLVWFVRLAHGYEYKTSAELSVLDDAEQTGDRRSLLPSLNSPKTKDGGRSEDAVCPSMHQRFSNNNISSSSSNGKLSRDSSSSRLSTLRLPQRPSQQVYETVQAGRQAGEEREASWDIDAGVTMSIDSNDALMSPHVLQQRSQSPSVSADHSRVFSTERFASSLDETNSNSSSNNLHDLSMSSTTSRRSLMQSLEIGNPLHSTATEFRASESSLNDH